MGEVIYGVNFRKQKTKTLEEMACEMMDVIWRPWFLPTPADTAPCEMIPYHTDQEPA